MLASDIDLTRHAIHVPRPWGPLARDVLGLDADAVRATLTPEQRLWWDHHDEHHRRFLLLNYAVANGAPGWEATGLTPVAPPPAIHLVERGDQQAGGDTHAADLVLAALEVAGVEPRRGLDFGCSSGPVLRVLAAARPDADWAGCDPNAEAVAWAHDELGLDTFVGPQEPPLERGAGALDVAYAMSIWSHFGHDAALAWLAEMHRLVRPGGVLLLTANGMHTLAVYTERGAFDEDGARRIHAALHGDGFWWEPVFGEAGDWGVKHEQWGLACFTPEWLLQHATPAWRLAAYWPGAYRQVQDVYVLARR